MAEKLNPLQMVARELADNGDMEREHVESVMTDLLDFLNARAVSEIDKDPESAAAMAAAVQYRVACEIVATFGTALIAFEDMESGAARSGPGSN